MLTLSAAGFIATSTSGASPGVKISLEAKLIWKPETPGSVPAGARISAGKSGKVAMSLPTAAEVDENWLPVTCIPSPESPAKRITTLSSLSTRRPGEAGLSVVAILMDVPSRVPMRLNARVSTSGPRLPRTLTRGELANRVGR